jgi:hypothetical protein
VLEKITLVRFLQNEAKMNIGDRVSGFYGLNRTDSNPYKFTNYLK